MSPRPAADHQWAPQELGFQSRTRLPVELVVLPEVEVVVTEPRPPAPDVTAATVPDLRDWRPCEAILA